jgi:hypothetical protein
MIPGMHETGDEVPEVASQGEALCRFGRVVSTKKKIELLPSVEPLVIRE